MLNLAHVRAFVVLAEELHFGRAALRLNMTQSPLTRQIQLLEQELDAPLLTRANRRIRLTKAGRAFLSEAIKLVETANTAKQAVKRAASEHVGTVSIGFFVACSYGFLPRLIARARTELPEVLLKLYEGRTSQQIDAVAQGRLDLGLIRPTVLPRHIRSTCVYREGLALALPVDHPLARQRRPKLSQLDGEPFIMYSTEGRHLHDVLIAAFATADVKPQIVQELSHAQVILSLVSTGLGIAVVPEEARNACFDNVIFRPIDLGAKQTADLHLIWRTDQTDDSPSAVRDLIFQMSYQYI